MDRKLECDIVKDLLPLYVDGVVSDVSQRRVKEHLEECTACNEIYHDMTYDLEMEKQPEAGEVKDVKRFLKRTKQMYFIYGLSGICFIAIFVCLIVDLSINKTVTWSLIVGCAVLFGDAFVYAVTAGKRKKGCIAMSVVSIGTFVLLTVIQVSRYYFMHVGTFWLFRYGFPIMFLWLGILWMPVLCREALKWNIWDCIALFMLLVIVGNYATKLITGDYVWDDVLAMRGFAGNALGEVVGAVVFGIIGRVNASEWREKAFRS